MESRVPDGVDPQPTAPDQTDPDAPRLVMRPVTNPAAIELAQQLLESGVPGIELRPDGTLWARGVDRRRRDRRSGGEHHPDRRAR